MASAFPVSSATVLINVWVDTSAVIDQSGTAIYVVDNRTGSKSQNEGTSTLQTCCSQNSTIAWQVIAIDPAFESGGGTLQIQSIGNSNAWGSSGQPEATDDPTIFTGQAQNSVSAPYVLTLNVQPASGTGITSSVNLGMNVTGA